MSSPPMALTRTVAALLLTALSFAACDAGEAPLASEKPGSSPTSAPAVMPSPEPPPPPRLRSDCRWQGYGIGLADRKQCNTTHLLAHAADQCFGRAGEASETRIITGTCGSEAEEVQIHCCLADGAAPTSTWLAGRNWLDRQLRPAGASSSRADLILRAEQECANGGKNLGDWSALYAPDGVSADLLRFGCN